MSKNDARAAGEPMVGPGGPPIENVSGQVKTVGATVRHNARGAGGRFRPREARLVGPLGSAGGVGPGGVDSVSGRWIPGVRNHAQLHDLERVTATTTRPHYEVRDYSAGVHPDRKSHVGSAEAHTWLENVMTCAACAAGVCNG